MIRLCERNDFNQIWTVINDGAQAYKGIIPEDRWAEPYMTREKLQSEIDAGVVFWGFWKSDTMVGVMGIQSVQDVTLIRHAYVLRNHQQRGIGASLLSHLRELTQAPILIGAWADAVWAINFYKRHGFIQVSVDEKNRLLEKYWKIPERQVETSVVLSNIQQSA